MYLVQKLETFEDFVQVAQALLDLKTCPDEYRVQGFGYCTVCQKVTAHTRERNSERSWYSCGGGCKGHYGWNNETHLVYLMGDLLPEAVRGEVEKHDSREEQKKFFLEKLDAFCEMLVAKKKQLEDEAYTCLEHVLLLDEWKATVKTGQHPAGAYLKNQPQ